MTAERWARIMAAVEEIETASPVERNQILERLGTEDEHLRDEVENFLGEETSGTLIHGIIGEQAASLNSEKLNDTAGRQQRFGRYELVSRIGQGGMGAVYEAVRVDDFHKKVALKIIRQGLDSDFARSRFLQERQMLAGLEHPNIARLLDGGESEDGSPYLVMEFVDGEPIHKYCDKLNRTARLRLFLKVCEGVGHAHRNLVIHRDLKPANILVTATGEPKLLDFGIAKLVDSGSEQTRTGFTALTPDYASPEQVRGEPISTASDVYSLGVILYQILTERRPYTIVATTALEMERVICFREPDPPDLGDELDHILLMSLRKEPLRRYASVERFAEDIERYLDHEPVRARPDTTWYRMRKYARRHWIGLLAASLTFLAVFGGAGVAVYQARIARQRFNDVRQLSNSFLFDFDKEIAALPGAVKARQMLVDTSLKYLNNLSRDAGGDLSLQRELAQAYQKVGDVQGSPGGASLGRLNDALVSYGKSLAIYEQIARQDPKYKLELAASQKDNGWAWQFTWDLPKAVSHYRAAIDILEALNRETPVNVDVLTTLGRCYNELAQVYLLDLNDTDALAAAAKSQVYTEAGIADYDAGRKAKVLASREARRLTILADQGDFVRSFESVALVSSLVKVWKANIPNDAQAIRFDVVNDETLSQIYDSDYAPSLDDTAQALAHITAADKIVEALMKDKSDADAPMIHAVHLRRFSYLHGKSDPQTGIREGREAIAILEQLTNNSPSDSASAEVLASTRILLGEHLSRLGRGPEARETIESGLASYRTLVKKTGNSAMARRAWIRSLASVSTAWRNLNDLPAALKTSREAAETAATWQAQGSREVALLFVLGNAYVEYGRCLKLAKRLDEARRWFEKDAAIWKSLAPGNRYVELRDRQSSANLVKN